MISEEEASSESEVRHDRKESQISELEELLDQVMVGQPRGSSLGGAIFNFTNCIVGAGAIGLGGAIAMSGGLISIVLIVFFAIITKFSLDLVIELSDGKTYEESGEGRPL